MSQRQLRARVVRVLTRKHSLHCQADAVTLLVGALERVPPAGADAFLDAVAQAYLASRGPPLVSAELLDATLAGLAAQRDSRRALADNSGAFDFKKYFDAVSAFAVPRATWTPRGLVVDSRPRSLFGDASSKPRLLYDSFHAARQRVLRQGAGFWRAAAARMDTDGNRTELTPVKHLRGLPRASYRLFGMLTRMPDGKVYLEDPDAQIELVFSDKTTKSIGIFTENCLVLIHGIYHDDLKFIEVEQLAMPPPEPRAQTLAAIGGKHDFFGGRHVADDEERALLARIERSFPDVALAVLSDVWLDQPRVMAKLRELFAGYSQPGVSPPAAFILFGNFTSAPFVYNSECSKQYRECFNSLAELIVEFPAIHRACEFVLVPGANDPWAGDILPRPPIPHFFLDKMLRKFNIVNGGKDSSAQSDGRGSLYLMSNPCRIRYCNKEIVLFREDLMTKLRRNALIESDQLKESDFVEHTIRTVIDQAHLSPLPIEKRPLYWEYESSLRLNPTPDVLILADMQQTYVRQYNGCLCLNPGSFMTTDFEFIEYKPGSSTAETSQIS